MHDTHWAQVHFLKACRAWMDFILRSTLMPPNILNLRKIGFKQGVASSSVYHHKEMGISTLVHGDDYVSVGSEEALEWLKKRLEDDYEIKTTVVGRHSFARRHNMAKSISRAT